MRPCRMGWHGLGHAGAGQGDSFSPAVHLLGAELGAPSVLSQMPVTSPHSPSGEGVGVSSSCLFGVTDNFSQEIGQKLCNRGQHIQIPAAPNHWLALVLAFPAYILRGSPRTTVTGSQLSQ